MFRTTTIILGLALALGSAMLPVAAYARGGGGSGGHGGGSAASGPMGGGTMSGGHPEGASRDQAGPSGLGFGQGNHNGNWPYQYCGSWRNRC